MENSLDFHQSDYQETKGNENEEGVFLNATQGSIVDDFRFEKNPFQGPDPRRFFKDSVRGHSNQAKR
jgi:hypothetical protein